MNSYSRVYAAIDLDAVESNMRDVYKRQHFDIKREELITIPGVVCACSFIIYALTEKGDKVMVNLSLIHILGKDKIHRNACPSFHELQMSIEREIPEGGF